MNIALPDSLARKVDELASRDGISADQFVSLAVSEKISSWITEEDWQLRASRASREKFEQALAQVPDVPPLPGDELG